DDADCLAHIDGRAAGEITPIALAADPVHGVAGQYRADTHLLHARSLDSLYLRLLEQRASLHHNLVARRVAHVFGRGATKDAAFERGDDLPGIDNGAHLDAARGSAILIGDDAVLRHVDQPTGQITGVCGLQRRVSEAFARAMGRVEV